MADKALSDQRVPLQSSPLRSGQRATFVEYLVRDPDFSHVMKKEPPLQARVVEQRGLKLERESSGIRGDSARVGMSAPLPRLERIHERLQCLPVCVEEKIMLALSNAEQSP